jgi:hypothetical protein
MNRRRLQSVFVRVLALSAIPAACGGVTNVEPGASETDAGPLKQADAAVGDHVVQPPTDAGRKKDAIAREPDADDEMDDADVPEDASSSDAEVTDAGACTIVGTPTPDASVGNCFFDVVAHCSVEPDNVTCRDVCSAAGGGPFVFGCGTTGVVNGDSYVVRCYTCGVGRRPEGFAANAPECDATPLGAYFDVLAELEAASVFAFERLEDELRQFDAPSTLQRRARAAANDERRHAKTMRGLARRTGGAKRALKPAPQVRYVRSLEAIACENAVEGCIRETFGALTASLQAARATDPAIRAAMERIAFDETNHAALAWAVAEWATPKLSAAANARIERAMEEAIATLESELEASIPSEVRTRAGLPAREEARAMLTRMRELLWEPALAA